MKEIFLQISNRQDLSQDQVKQSLTAFSKMKSQKAKSLPSLWGLKLREKHQMKSQVSCVPSNHMRRSCLRPSQMLCVTVVLVETNLIALTFQQRLALSQQQVVFVWLRLVTVRFPLNLVRQMSLKSLESTLRHHQKSYLKHLTRLVWPLSLHKPCTQPCVLSVQLAKLLGFQRL